MSNTTGGQEAHGTSTPGFVPRPEPHGMRWVDLAEPLKPAVEKLLSILADIANMPGKPEDRKEQNNNLLVTGSRGAGKTTVLMTARHAIEHRSIFLTDVATTKAEELTKILERLKDRFVWLDVLNMEPLPATANLLATLLVRVRGALEGSGSAKERASILEEATDDCWNRIDKLVRDAAFFWDETPVQDPRTNADLEIKSAEIFARFRKELTNVIELVCKTLTTRYRGHHQEQNVILLLPIDNIDRTSKHLYSIVKLAQIVTCPHLWLLLAADTSDFQLFLERAFQNELGTGFGAESKAETSNDMAIAARRQAAAAARKLIPITHRIKIEDDSSKHALAFKPEKPMGTMTLGNLLHEIELCSEQNFSTGKLRLSHIFTLKDWNVSNKEKDLTEAGNHALNLTTRQLIDLWQLLNELRGRPRKAHHSGAIRLAASMLNSVAAESPLPIWANELLGESEVLGAKILKSHSHEGEHLNMDLSGNPIRRVFVVSPHSRIELQNHANKIKKPYIFSTTVALERSHGVFLQFTDPKKRPGDEYIDPHESRAVFLPSAVEGWFMILFDLIALQSNSTFLNLEPDKINQNLSLASTTHEIMNSNMRVNKIKLTWPLPSWPTFIDLEIFTHRWRAFIDMISDMIPDEISPELGIRLLSCAWLSNACQVSKGDEWDPKHHASRRAEAKELEIETLDRLNALYTEVCSKIGNSNNLRRSAIRTWLEAQVPVFLMPELLPITTEISKCIFTPTKDDLKRNRLCRYWHERREQIAYWRLQEVARALAENETLANEIEAEAEDESPYTEWFEAAEKRWPWVSSELNPLHPPRKPKSLRIKGERRVINE